MNFSRTGRAAAPSRAAACLATAAAVILTGILTGAPAAPASAVAGGWTVTPSPNPRVPTGQLFWVSCPAADSCVAVGTYVTTSGEGVNLAEQWNGTSWRILPTPSPAGVALSGLLGVACTSPSACTAVGASLTTTGVPGTVAERWNGTRWTLQATPSLPPGGGSLNAVACTSESACTAVGGSSAGTLAERWNGTTWTIQVTPDPPQGGGSLSGVACTSESACTAVGGSSAGTLAEQWDGASWSIQPTPDPAQGGGFLTSVACPSPSACTAVGVSSAGTLAEARNGASWSIQPTPTPAGAQFAFLNTVACASPSACTAAGSYANSSGTAQTLAEHWNGTAWRRQATPSPGPSLLIGLACTSAAACTAVGYTDTSQSPAVLVERSAGTTWGTQAAPNPPGAASSVLNGVACASRSACTAVGFTTSRSRAVVPLAERRDGGTWQLQPTASPAGGGALNDVSCTSPSACTAVGGSANGSTLAERWNGASWAIQATPSPPGGGFLNGVSCTSSSACTAVGNSGNGGTLAERWNGTSWAIEPTPDPSGSAFTILSSVACTSSSACMAAGGRLDSSGNGAGTLAERWNGRKWLIVPTFRPTGQGSFLNGVSCTSASACTAVGSSGPATTLAERWNGTSWQVQPTPNPPGGQNIFLASVACPASSACTAFGLDLTGSGPLTLAERWNGTSWAIQATPGLVTFDTGFPGVACPTPSACVAVASYTNNGPNLTLAEQWDGAAGFQPAPSRLAAPRGLAPACAPAGRLGAVSGRRSSPAQRWRSVSAPGLRGACLPRKR